MGLWRAIKRKIRASVAPVVFLAVTSYFCWNATQGALGLKAYALRQQDLLRAQAGLARAQADEAAWAHRVAALQTARIDADALDERARAILNLSEPNEIVVPYAKNDRLF
jgi:cell division protein FtsB